MKEEKKFYECLESKKQIAPAFNGQRKMNRSKYWNHAENLKSIHVLDPIRRMSINLSPIFAKNQVGRVNWLDAGSLKKHYMYLLDTVAY